MTEDHIRQPDATGDYTAVIYFHGMGEQRRYEEVSQLIDTLDGYAHYSFHGANRPPGKLQRIRARLEPPRGEQKRDVSYVRVYHKPANAPSAPVILKPFRFYEAYWAPVTAGGRSAWAVIRWMLRQILTPFAMLKSPWRERQRQRRASLHSLWENMRQSGYGEFSALNFAQLLTNYNEFERADSRREFPGGSFEDFKLYLKQKNERHPDRLSLLLKLADLWYRQYIRTEYFTLFSLLSLGIALALGFGGLLLLVSTATNTLTNLLTNSNPEFTSAPIVNVLTWGAQYGRAHIVEVTLSFISIMGIARFLRDYMGDVQIWSTYQETDINYVKRREILDNSVQLLSHVLADPHCHRVVVVAYSLGTAIAIDALLELGRYNRARNGSAPMLGPIELEKLDQVVTLGSPIDKIHYFFESRTSKHHRFNRVVEEVRGDIGTVPFAKNRKPHMHWINFWDVGDMISGPLETSSNPRDPWLRVDNVRVQSYRFPDPGASHLAYFKHLEVVGHLFEIIFEGTHSLRGFSLSGKNQDALEKQFLGPGTGSSLPRLIQAAVLAVPWIIMIGVLAYAFNAPPGVVTFFYWLAAFLAAGCTLLWLGSLFRGHLKPLPIIASGESDED